VTFSVAGELFRAHRCVLAARSPVFQAELFGPVKEQATHTRPIRIDDTEPAIFEALLHFIYTDSCNAGGNVAMQHLLVAADRYGLDRLKAIWVVPCH
jgi:speckle-type POZ protein